MNDSQEREIFLPMLEKYLGAPAPVIKLQSAEEFSLDLFTLFKVVQSLGGFRACTEAEFWPIVAECLISEEALPNRTDAEDWAASSLKYTATYCFLSNYIMALVSLRRTALPRLCKMGSVRAKTRDEVLRSSSDGKKCDRLSSAKTQRIRGILSLLEAFVSLKSASLHRRDIRALRLKSVAHLTKPLEQMS
eukprot:CAMPEP_0184675648 /NCGR_PEP_ID=MMETSP0308-20130426/87903_1 /TAXON_ID=38269 /ORGANISM="Gloeochaete witrockiana, Strain SAG 46.84" /LENGTH=190 /DNA_ID=CAMNT_0027123369 /DNA_START=173 /DNA_END=746 /DNA_ORIENTATION=-